MALLGAVDDYAHRPFFVYTDRWMTLDGTTSSKLAKDMWTTYRSTVTW
jgi:hypothetical protein